MSKTLYININNEQIQSNDELEVLKHDLDSDFFFYLGEKTTKSCKVENENALITDFNTQDNAEDYKQIITQWNEIKTILFSEECEGKIEFTLPNGYIHWLRYSEKYNHVYDKNFSHGESTVITIDLEELYEDSVEDLQRKILRKLQRDDFYLEIDEIVFNDDAVTRKSPIVRTIKEKYEGIGFKAYKKWLEGNKETSYGIETFTTQICSKCEKNPCECCSTSPLHKDYFPLEGVILFKTSFADVQREYLEFDDNLILYKPKDGITFIQDRREKFFSIVCISEEQAYPKLWENLLGLRWNMSYEICKSILVKNGHKYKSNEMPLGCGWSYSLFVLSIDEKYIFNLGYLHNKLNYIRVFLNKCPHCNSDNLVLLEHFNPSSIKMRCKDCEILLLDSMVIECPECHSVNIKDNGSNYLQYTCNDCGHNWGHNDTVECPECTSDDIEDYRTDDNSYECNVCGHRWGDDEDVEDY